MFLTHLSTAEGIEEDNDPRRIALLTIGRDGWGGACNVQGFDQHEGRKKLSNINCLPSKGNVE